MQANVIQVGPKGSVALQSPDGKPFSFDATAALLIQQRQYRKRRVPLEHNGGKPIVRVVTNRKT